MRATFRRMQGSALIVVLLLLALLMMMAGAAVTGSVSEERLARAHRDYNVAFQAAESALRDARADLLGLGSRNPPILGAPSFADIAAGTCNSVGLCVPSAAGATPVWDHEVNWTGNAVPYGLFTGAQPLPSTGPGAVSQPPRYLIEYLGAVGSQSLYRLTARGWGPVAGGLFVTLQEEVVR